MISKIFKVILNITLFVFASVLAYCAWRLILEQILKPITN